MTDELTAAVESKPIFWTFVTIWDKPGERDEHVQGVFTTFEVAKEAMQLHLDDFGEKSYPLIRQALKDGLPDETFRRYWGGGLYYYSVKDELSYWQLIPIRLDVLHGWWGDPNSSYRIVGGITQVVETLAR